MLSRSGHRLADGILRELTFEALQWHCDDDMGTDPFSLLAPARVRVLVLPCGKITKRRFATFVERLQQVSSVKLRDVAGAETKGRDTFAPTAFPDGRILLDISSNAPPSSYSPYNAFELFRGPLVIIGTIDAREYEGISGQAGSPMSPTTPTVFLQRAHDGFISAMENAQDQYAGALVTQLLVMDATSQEEASWIPQGSLHLSLSQDSSEGAPMPVMGTILGRLLGEMASLSKRMSSWDSVPTPVTPISQSQRSDSERRPSARASGMNQLSRESSNVSESVAWSHARQLSQVHGNGSPAMTESPRPDSPTGRSETPSSPDRASIPDTIPGSDDFKPRNRFSQIVMPNGHLKASPEKEKSIGKTRLGIALGSLYLLSGRWPDALRELVEHANRARSLHDYIWLAVGVERILICLILLASEDYAAQIPSICLSSAERQSSIPFIDSGRDASPVVGPRDAESTSASLRKLGASINDICATILTYHDRAGTYSGETLAALPYAELIIRLTKLQACLVAHSNPFASETWLPRSFVEQLSRQPGDKGRPAAIRLSICDAVFRAFPSANADLDVESKISLLTGIVAVLSTLNMDRKRAVVLRELVRVLVPTLHQARRLGAAELGIHPSTSLSHANDALLSADHSGLRHATGGILGELLSIYAISSPVLTATLVDEPVPNGSHEQAFHLMLTPLLRAANLDHLGSLQLKLDILRASIDFCEAVPDLDGMAYNAALLLSTAGPHRPIDPAQRQLHVTLSTDEQVRLAGAISTIAGSASGRQTPGRQPAYWDDFLVRSVQLAGPTETGKLTEHTRADMSAATAKSLFLHDPFAQKASKQESIIVAGERAAFAVVLQNPYDFEIRVEEIHLVLDDQEQQFNSVPVNAVLGPRRLQEIILTAIPERSGTCKIMACRVKMAGCREGTFFINNEPWQVEAHVKVKEAAKPASISGALDRAVSDQTRTLPPPASVEISVIPSQPVMVIESVGLNNGSLMLLEGEKSSFRITLRNVNATVGVDFLRITMEDALLASLRGSLASKSLSRADLYHIEHQIAENPVFSWRRLDNASSELIEAGAEAAFEVSILGKAGLRDARILFDFAHVNGSDDTFYTRRLTVPVNVTVNACVELQHFDVMRLAHSTDALKARGQCLVILDLRNSWSTAVEVDLGITGHDEPASDQAQKKLIQPFQTARFALPMQRLYVKHPHAQIPWLSPQNRRQFVVSNTGDLAEQRTSREVFWYREELFKAVRGTWRDVSSARRGEVSLHGIALKQQHLDVLRAEDLDISSTISVREDVVGQGTAKQTGAASFDVTTRSFLTLAVTLTNRSVKAIHPMLRLLPMVANHSQESGPEVVSRRLVWSGALQQPVAMIEPGQSRKVELGFCALSSGMYSIGVVVEEIRPAMVREERKEENNDDDDHDEAGKPAEERRVWRAPDLCSIRAV